LNIFWIVVSFLFGLCIGSFLNVSIYRIPSGKSLFLPGSHCPGCGVSIKWYDNIPVLSYIVLSGKCRSCKGEISIRYPLVELLTGCLFALFYFIYIVVENRAALVGDRGAVGVLVVHLALVSALISATFIDIDHQIIPDGISIGGLAIAPVVSLFFPALHEIYPILHEGAPFTWFGNEHFGALADSLAGMVAGGGFIFVVGWLGKRIWKREAMGFGDVKLMAMVGAFLGWKAVIFANLIAPFFGCIVGIPLWLRSRQRFMRIPYGPFLAGGTVVIMLCGSRLVAWYYGLIIMEF
jgi:leader peptidase (prepilin peptidase)/N-methyltransferase